MNKVAQSVILALVIVFATSCSYGQSKVAQHLQDISVTIKSGNSEGSGILITREMFKTDKKKEKVTVNFVWTAAHVVDNLRSTRTIVGKSGQSKTVVEFKDAQIVQELVENGRKVGELKMDAKVILYSDSEEGEDLAVLMVRKRSFVNKNTAFYLEDKTVPIGTELFHVGSLLGQSGANSMTNGIMSQVGRVINLGSGDGTVFDQTTVTAFPGSSGGGVFLTDGKYVGMLVRGAGETFNLIVPVRRMKSWAKSRDAEWVIDPSKPLPSISSLRQIEPEDESVKYGFSRSEDSKKFNYMILDKVED